MHNIWPLPDLVKLLTTAGTILGVISTILERRKARALHLERQMGIWSSIAAIKALMRHLERQDVQQAYGQVCQLMRQLFLEAARVEGRKFTRKRILWWRAIGKLSSDWQEVEMVNLDPTFEVTKGVAPPERSTYSNRDQVSNQAHPVAKLGNGDDAAGCRSVTTPGIPGKVLFIGEKSHWGRAAGARVKQFNPDATLLFWTLGDPKPDWLVEWRGDWIVSFKSDLLLPVCLIANARRGAVNIHPASPQYRGIGGYHYAIYNNDREYGVTAHVLTERIDFVEIIETRTFPIVDGETASSLRERAAACCLGLLDELLVRMRDGHLRRTSAIKWSGSLSTRAQLSRFLDELRSKKAEHPALL